jgi:hypothetical protein
VSVYRAVFRTVGAVLTAIGVLVIATAIAGSSARPSVLLYLGTIAILMGVLCVLLSTRDLTAAGVPFGPQATMQKGRTR